MREQVIVSEVVKSASVGRQLKVMLMTCTVAIAFRSMNNSGTLEKMWLSFDLMG